MNNNTEPLYIVGPPEDFTGLIDDVRIYDRAMTPDEVSGPSYCASGPVPSNGEGIDGSIHSASGNIYAVLDFTPGDDPCKHTAYFSENEQDVINRVQDANLGPPPFEDSPPPWNTWYYVGYPPVPPANDFSLERGRTYYWCVDTTDSNGVVCAGSVWNFYVRRAEASGPDPTDGQIYVSLTPTLTWNQGVPVEGDPHEHEVYFGYTFDDVNNAIWSDPEYMGFQEYDDEAWAPVADGGLTLDYETTYYWRIDEAHERSTEPPPPFLPLVTVKGDVWTFTTVPYIPPEPNLLGWWKFDESTGTTALDWSGNDNHGTLFGDPLRVAGMIGQAIDFDGSDDYVDTGRSLLNNLSEFTLCGWVSAGNPLAGRIGLFGQNDAIEFGFDGGGAAIWTAGGGQWLGSTWTHGNLTWHHIAAVGNGTNLTLYVDGVVEATGGSVIDNYGSSGFSFNIGGGGIWDGSGNWLSGQIDDVRVYDYALSQAELMKAMTPLEAWGADPADGSLVDPSEFVACTWRAGSDAAQHKIYWCVGDDPANLVHVDTKDLGDETYAPLGGIEFVTSYCWRIDEVNGLDSWVGNVWKFSTVREPGMGSILRERWDNITGGDLNILKNDLRFPDYPSESNEITSFDSGIGLGDDYGGRIHGWLIPETTGDYRFWITTDDPGELYLNFDGPDYLDVTDPANQEYLIAYIPANNWADPYIWDSHATQDSDNVVGHPIHLEADQKYYISGLWKEVGGGDHCQVAWYCPDAPDVNILPVNGSADAIIDGWYLMPFTRLWASNPRPRHRQELSAEQVTEISWIPGINAVRHHLYFDDDPNVEDAPLIYADLPLASNSIDPTNYEVDIDWETTYYWRVDEVNNTHDDSPWIGSKWWFRTTNYAFPEDFESYPYTGGSADANGIRFVWKDGWSFAGTTGVKSGSNIVLSGIEDPENQRRPRLHWEEHDDGEKAMAVYYDNDGDTFAPGYSWYIYTAPKYSEVEASTIDLGIGRDWTRQNIQALSMWFKGHPTRTGSFSSSGSDPLGPYTATMTSNGDDIGDIGPDPYHDEFHYAYKKLVGYTTFLGCGNIIARIDSIDPTDPWAKAGVMMRESFAEDSNLADANYAMVAITPRNGVVFQYRNARRGPVTQYNQTGITAPHWVWLQRENSHLFTAYHANDVEAAAWQWRRINDSSLGDPDSEQIINMNRDVYVGLCLTSGSPTRMCTAQFSDVQFTPETGISSSIAPASGFPSRDIGILSNDPEPMYIALEDIYDGVGVKYHDDPNAALIWRDWQEWNIDLADPAFAAVDMNDVDMIYIGFGDRVNKPGGGSGCVYFDDLRLYRSRYVQGVYPAMPANVNEDGLVDEKDLAVMADDWLLTDSNNVPTSLSAPANLIAQYQFEGDASDSVSPYYHGTAYGDPTYSTDSREGTYSIEFDGAYAHVVVGSVGIDSNDARTIACWAKASTTSIANWANVFGFCPDIQAGNQYFDIEKRGDQDQYCIHVHGWEENIIPLDLEWHHLAVTYDGITISWYGDGEFVSSEVRDINTIDYVRMGYRPSDNAWFPGLVDDARIYNRALTELEIAYVVDDTPGDGWMHLPVPSPANLYNEEPEGSQTVNFKDFAVLANKWLLEEPTWP